MSKPSPGEIEFSRGGIKKNIRNDGRKNLDVREIWLKSKTLYQANGSCTLEIPDSSIKIYVGIKVKFAKRKNPQSYFVIQIKGKKL